MPEEKYTPEEAKVDLLAVGFTDDQASTLVKLFRLGHGQPTPPGPPGIAPQP